MYRETFAKTVSVPVLTSATILDEARLINSRIIEQKPHVQQNGRHDLDNKVTVMVIIS